MSISKGYQLIIALVLGILIVLVATPWDMGFLKEKKETSVATATAQLKNASTIYIIEILTENSTLNRKIMQCGVDIAFSMGRYNKSVHPYIINNSRCYTEWGVFPVWLCAKSLYFKTGFFFFVEKGIPVSTYQNMITIDPLKATNCEVILPE